MIRSFAFLVIASAACASAALAPLAAQSRELSWPAISVTAHLDATGRLTVRETQVMRFTGDWNGGERTFNIRTGQEFALQRLARVDSATGAERDLERGDLSAIDQFKVADGNTLRWRSRLPTDAPFENTVRTYVIEYALGNILVPQRDGSFLLDNDFAFADRVGVIERFTLDLTLDPIWSQSAPGFTGHYVMEQLQPGRGFVVSLPLRYSGGGRPASVFFGASRELRLTLATALVLAILTLLQRLIARERRLGRFAPLVLPHEVTPAFLQEHVFSRLPEVVGAAWDDQTAAPEVAATLARLVQEKKLSSSVNTSKARIFKKEVLHLKLEVPRSQLQAHEQLLINGLFSSGDDNTDTDRVRTRYKSSGFDPAALIKKRLARMVEVTTPGESGTKPSWRPTALMIAAAVMLLIVGIGSHTADVAIVAGALAVSVPLFILAAVGSYAWQRSVAGLTLGALWFVLPLGVMAFSLGGLLLAEGQISAGAFTLAGLVAWVLALANSIRNNASSRQSPERIVVRKQLMAAREFFRAELARPQPRLQDAWFPYLIAFGLGKHIDKWFRAFGGAMAASSASMIATSGAGERSSGSGSSWTGFGGGGGFSGAGSSASFAAAVGGMAASVPSPGSSSSGGGGGGGSSGGGGGGGW